MNTIAFIEIARMAFALAVRATNSFMILDADHVSVAEVNDGYACHYEAVYSFVFDGAVRHAPDNEDRALLTLCMKRHDYVLADIQTICQVDTVYADYLALKQSEDEEYNDSFTADDNDYFVRID
jgi:hypothetical protein